MHWHALTGGIDWTEVEFLCFVRFCRFEGFHFACSDASNDTRLCRFRFFWSRVLIPGARCSVSRDQGHRHLCLPGDDSLLSETQVLMVGHLEWKGGALLLKSDRLWWDCSTLLCSPCPMLAWSLKLACTQSPSNGPIHQLERSIQLAEIFFKDLDMSAKHILCLQVAAEFAPFSWRSIWHRILVWRISSKFRLWTLFSTEGLMILQEPFLHSARTGFSTMQRCVAFLILTIASDRETTAMRLRFKWSKKSITSPCRFHLSWMSRPIQIRAYWAKCRSSVLLRTHA